MNTTARSIIARKERVVGNTQPSGAANDQAQLIRFAKPSHTVQFYEDDALYVSEVSRFIGTALIEGDAAVVVATEAHREAVALELQNIGLDLAKVVKRGCYITLDAAETLDKFMKNGWPDEALFNQTFTSVFEQTSSSRSGQSRHISAFGEMVTLLWEQGLPDAALRLEQMWNELAKTYSFSLRCAYPTFVFDRKRHGDKFVQICGERGSVIPVESHSKLVTEEEKLRSVSELQQKAVALESEIEGRKRTEEALLRAKAQLEETVEHRTSTLRQLSARLLTLQDIERRRIARELHDSFGQYLVGLKINVNLLRESPEKVELWTEAEKLMQKCLGEVRTLSYLLHPPTMDEAGFVSAARWYVEGFGQRSGVKVTLNAPEELDRLPDTIELTLFRVLQEALTNVHRHSGASRAYVSISRHDDDVRLEVRDDGRGMPPDLLHNFVATGVGMGVGLAGVRERAREVGGKLTMEADHSGTLLAISIPLLPSERKRKFQTT